MLPLTELGNKLKEAREEKGLTLDDLQNITKIQKRYLAGIEEGNYDAIPGKFYVRAFIKQYAEAVGIDPEKLFDEYKHEIPSVYEESIPENLSRTHSRKNISDKSSKFMDNLPKIIISLLVIGIALLIWYFAQSFAGNENAVNTSDDLNNKTSVQYEESGQPPVENNDDQEEEKSKEQNKDEKAAADETEQPPTKETELDVISTEGNTTTYELKNTDTFELALKATNNGQSWIEVYNLDNSETFFKAMLTVENPQTFDLSNEQGARIRIGATQATEIYINGEKVEYASTATVQNIIIKYQKSEE